MCWIGLQSHNPTCGCADVRTPQRGLCSPVMGADVVKQEPVAVEAVLGGEERERERERDSAKDA